MGLLEAGPATDVHQSSAADGVAACRASMADQGVAAEGLPARLMDRLDHPRWIDVADRCLACANCTMVCPTCFCTSVGQISDLDGAVNQTERRWDSCFNGDFAKVAGGNFRPRRQDRYRQWLTHKFATWHEQFGTWLRRLRTMHRLVPGGDRCPGRAGGDCPAVRAAPPPRSASDPLDDLVPLPMVSFSPTVTAPAAMQSDTSVGTVRAVMVETADTSTLRIEPDDANLLAAQPGQFVMVEQPGFSPVPISVSRVDDGALWLTIRAAGLLQPRR